MAKSPSVLVLHLIGWEVGASFLDQLQSVVKQLSTGNWETDQNVNIINRVGENSHPLWLIFSCKKK